MQRKTFQYIFSVSVLCVIVGFIFVVAKQFSHTPKSGQISSLGETEKAKKTLILQRILSTVPLTAAEKKEIVASLQTTNFSHVSFTEAEQVAIVNALNRR